MEIKELENMLSVSRSNIRFYEKQGLLTPKRQENRYRDYSDEDVRMLKKIIVLRKMGFTVEEILRMQKGELSLTQAVPETQKRLQEEIEQLEGALKMLSHVSGSQDTFEQMDVDGYWETIRGAEQSGERFIDICKDFLDLELKLFDNMWRFCFFFNFKKYREKYGVREGWIAILVICVARGIIRLFRGESFWDGFLYPWLVALGGTLLVLPLFLLSKKAPRVAAVIAGILFWLIILFFAAIFIFIIYGIIRAIVT
ncbi:MAG: MerR family transcriptional regulator [Clostridia bacterium]|nr:MerR family transcriptional regulator [Clostridia bacterium]